MSEISGRGIGLEVVREITTRLKGELSARSEVGNASTVEIRVPISLASIATLAVEAGGMVAFLPLDGVRAALALTPEEITRSPEGDAAFYEGQAIPFLPLSVMLARQAPKDRRSPSWLVTVIQADTSRVAVGVDRLLGTSHVVMKPLPPPIDTIPTVAGAAFDAEGNPHLVLDAAGLIAVVRTRRASLAPSAPLIRPRVLVIDDSLTTRMLEQSILQSAGYDVDVAISGEEALAKAKGHSYALFVVDIEMPGMDGFEFIERTRSHPILRRIPSILVSSRASPVDKRRGEEVGARAYIVKSEFDEAGLLQRIHELVGQ
ncbi:MAG: response regulator [Gammaproteobacteria bacterium]